MTKKTTVHDVIRAVFASKDSPAYNDRAAAIAALEDGAALAALGFTDDDQEAIEAAHSLLTQCAIRCVDIEILAARSQLMRSGY